MRMFSEAGRRVELHCTGVGKAPLAQLDNAQTSAIVRRVGLPGYTPRTITDESALRTALAEIRDAGYCLDEEEQEISVRCIAVLVRTGVASWMAISVSGLTTRVSDEVVARAVPLLQ